MNIRELRVTWIVRETEAVPIPCQTVSAAARQCIDLREELDEVFRAVFLDTRGCIFGQQDISRGSLNASIVHPRSIFRAAILANAASIIVAHNHPSGDPTPSPEDLAITKKLIECGTIVGIPVLDHLIVGRTSVVSLAELGLVNFR